MSEKDKKIFALIRENRFVIRLMTVLGISATAGASNELGVSNYTGEYNISRDSIVKTILEVDIKDEVNKRVDWFMKQTLDSLEAQYKDFIKRNNRQKRQQVKKMMGSVCEVGSFSGEENYCLAADIYNLKVVNALYGDASEILPPTDSNNGTWCRGFVSYMSKQYGEKYVKKSRNLRNDIKDFKPGTIVIVNYADRLHALTYSGQDEQGNAKIIGFNNEDNGLLKHYPNQGTIVDISELIKDKWHYKIKDKSKIEALQDLYRNRHDEMAGLVKKPKTFVATAEMLSQYAKKTKQI